jgi:tRNA nucleotidyltransferase (CCA-adding enzyme)
MISISPREPAPKTGQAWYDCAMQLSQNQIPSEVLHVTKTLEKAGFEGWVVGGCVRDLLLKREPNDWDVTTNATPEQIQQLFENTFYTNEFGTVGVVQEDAKDESLKIIEVTPYRLEGKYTDARRPDEVSFSQKIEDDLKRRDFTINALAYKPSTGKLLDLYEGVKDMDAGVVRAVGDPQQRFEEDALRILRAVRIAAELNFTIEEHTKEAIAANAAQLAKISKERIRDELVRIINSPQPMKALLLAHGLGLLQYIVPELEQGVGVEQNQAHSYDVFEHNLRALQHAADKNWPLDVRLAALLHDIGKPKARRFSDEKHDWTFHGHEVVGAKMTKKILENLKFSRETIDKVVSLVRWHMFFSDPDQITLSAVRRIVVNVGKDNIWDLINLRICDRIGTGRPKEQPFRLRKYQSMIEQALRDPISVGRLAIDGKKLMEITGERPGPRIGWILHALLEDVLDDPAKNTSEYLDKKAQELVKLSDEKLSSLGQEGKEKKEQAEEAEVQELRKKYFVE